MSKKSLNKYEKVFHRSIGFQYSITKNNQIDFYQYQFDDIKPAIINTLNFIDNYDFGEEQENVKIYSISVLPFLIADCKLDNPDIEDRKSKKDTLNWLNFIKNNRGMSNHLISTITTNKYKKDSPNITFDDFIGFDENKLNKQIELYKYLLSKPKTIKREFYSNVIQFLYLANSVDIAWKSESDKLEFLEHFFLEFNKDINSLTIKKQLLIASRKNPLTKTDLLKTILI